LTSVARTALLVGGVEDVEFAMIDVVAEKDIGDKLHN